MEDVKTGKAGRAFLAPAGVLLLLVWLASMSLDDDRLCSAVPLCFGFAAVLLPAVVGMVLGLRPARPTLIALFGLAAGLYFLLRCVAGDMLSEIWRELPLLLGCFTFYGAGYFLAQRHGGRALSLALVLGIAVNVAYFFLIRYELIPVEAKGRPTMSLGGPNRLRGALFAYENFVAMFLMVAGGVLICRPLWAGWKGWSRMAAALVGMAGVVCAFLVDSRAPAGLACLMLVVAWVLWAIIRLYGGKGVGIGLVLSGLALFVGIGVLLGELFMGNALVQQIASVDTHGRTDIWADIVSILPEVPWCGHGAGATPWQIAAVTPHYYLSNYAHNEYLQAWVDYGLVGVGLMVAVLIGHLAAGFWSLASEDIDRERRALVAACLFLLLCFAGCAVFDFLWHNVALAGLTAFACGVLASPVPSRRESLLSRRKWASGSRPALRPVRPMGRTVCSLCCIACLSLAAASGCFAWRLLPAWTAQWQYNALWRAGATDAERAAFLERLMPVYPDPEMADHYVTLHLPARQQDALVRQEKMLRLALASNPHQLFTVVMLADVLGNRGKYAEAEGLMRYNFPSDGPPPSDFANWPAYYGMNLLCWGRQRLVLGDRAAALSMMEYALRLYEPARKFRHFSIQVDGVEARNKAAAEFVAARRVELRLLRALGITKDDSWKQPLRPGGAPALYARWGDEEDAAGAEGNKNAAPALKK